MLTRRGLLGRHGKKGRSWTAYPRALPRGRDFIQLPAMRRHVAKNDLLTEIKFSENPN